MPSGIVNTFIILLLSVICKCDLDILENLKLNKNNSAATNDFIRSVLKAKKDLLWIKSANNFMEEIKNRKKKSQSVNRNDYLLDERKNLFAQSDYDDDFDNNGMRKKRQLEKRIFKVFNNGESGVLRKDEYDKHKKNKPKAKDNVYKTIQNKKKEKYEHKNYKNGPKIGNKIEKFSNDYEVGDCGKNEKCKEKKTEKTKPSKPDNDTKQEFLNPNEKIFKFTNSKNEERENNKRKIRSLIKRVKAIKKWKRDILNKKQDVQKFYSNSHQVKKKSNHQKSTNVNKNQIDKKSIKIPDFINNIFTKNKNQKSDLLTVEKNDADMTDEVQLLLNHDVYSAQNKKSHKNTHVPRQQDLQNYSLENLKNIEKKLENNQGTLQNTYENPQMRQKYHENQQGFLQSGYPQNENPHNVNENPENVHGYPQNIYERPQNTYESQNGYPQNNQNKNGYPQNIHEKLKKIQEALENTQENNQNAPIKPQIIYKDFKNIDGNPDNIQKYPQKINEILQNMQMNPQNANMNPQNNQVNPQNNQVKPQNVQVNPQNIQVNPQNPQVNPQNKGNNPQNTKNQPLIIYLDFKNTQKNKDKNKDPSENQQNQHISEISENLYPNQLQPTHSNQKQYPVTKPQHPTQTQKNPEHPSKISNVPQNIMRLDKYPTFSDPKLHDGTAIIGVPHENIILIPLISPKHNKHPKKPPHPIPFEPSPSSENEAKKLMDVDVEFHERNEPENEYNNYKNQYKINPSIFDMSPEQKSSEEYYDNNPDYQNFIQSRRHDYEYPYKYYDNTRTKEAELETSLKEDEKEYHYRKRSLKSIPDYDIDSTDNKQKVTNKQLVTKIMEVVKNKSYVFIDKSGNLSNSSKISNKTLQKSSENILNHNSNINTSKTDKIQNGKNETLSQNMSASGENVTKNNTENFSILILNKTKYTNSNISNQLSLNPEHNKQENYDIPKIRKKRDSNHMYYEDFDNIIKSKLIQELDYENGEGESFDPHYESNRRDLKHYFKLNNEFDYRDQILSSTERYILDNSLSRFFLKRKNKNTKLDEKKQHWKKGKNQEYIRMKKRTNKYNSQSDKELQKLYEKYQKLKHQHGFIPLKEYSNFEIFDKKDNNEKVTEHSILAHNEFNNNKKALCDKEKIKDLISKLCEPETTICPKSTTSIEKTPEEKTEWIDAEMKSPENTMTEVKLEEMTTAEGNLEEITTTEVKLEETETTPLPTTVCSDVSTICVPVCIPLAQITNDTSKVITVTKPVEITTQPELEAITMIATPGTTKYTSTTAMATTPIKSKYRTRKPSNWNITKIKNIEKPSTKVPHIKEGFIEEENTVAKKNGRPNFIDLGKITTHTPKTIGSINRNKTRHNKILGLAYDNERRYNKYNPRNGFNLNRYPSLIRKPRIKNYYSTFPRKIRYSNPYIIHNRMRKKKYPYGKYSDNIYDNSVRMKRSYGIPVERNRYEFVFPRKYFKNTRYKRKDRPVLRSKDEKFTRAEKIRSENEEELEKAKGILPVNIIESVYRQVQEKQNLKQIIAPVLRERPQSFMQMRAIEKFRDNVNEIKVKRTEEMLNVIMREINNIVYEQISSQTCQRLQPKLQEYLTWLTDVRKFPSSSEVDGEHGFELREINNSNVNQQDGPKFLFDATNNKIDSQALKKEKGLIRSLIGKYNRLNSIDKQKFLIIKNYLDNYLNTLTQLQGEFEKFNDVKTRYSKQSISRENSKKRHANANISKQYKKLYNRVKYYKNLDREKSKKFEEKNRKIYKQYKAPVVHKKKIIIQ